MKMAKKNKLGFLSANALKIIAVAAMIMDHASVIFIGDESTVWRKIGRISFSIFAFLIAQGAIHTKSRIKYLLRLVAFAFISEVPYDMAFNGTYFEITSQNVYFTLALGLLSIYIYDFLRAHGLDFLGIASTFLCGCAAVYLRSDHAFMGVVVITLMYMFNSVSAPVKYVGFAISAFMTTIRYVPPTAVFFLPSQITAPLSVIPIALYNGKQGRKTNKYIFYAIYPAHILILYLIKKYIVQ